MQHHHRRRAAVQHGGERTEPPSTAVANHPRPRAPHAEQIERVAAEEREDLRGRVALAQDRGDGDVARRARPGRGGGRPPRPASRPAGRWARCRRPPPGSTASARPYQEREERVLLACDADGVAEGEHGGGGVVEGDQDAVVAGRLEAVARPARRRPWRASCRSLAASHLEPCVPAWCATARRGRRRSSGGRGGDQPRDHRVRVPHLARAAARRAPIREWVRSRRGRGDGGRPRDRRSAGEDRRRRRRGPGSTRRASSGPRSGRGGAGRGAGSRRRRWRPRRGSPRRRRATARARSCTARRPAPPRARRGRGRSAAGAGLRPRGPRRPGR